jgi:hypothetical protein
LPATSEAIRGTVASFERAASRLGAPLRHRRGRNRGEAAIDNGEPMAQAVAVRVRAHAAV